MENEITSKWENYKKTVPGLNQSNDKVEDDNAIAYKKLLNQLPTELAQQLNDTVDNQNELPKQIEHSWCLCDMPEGEFPRVYMFKDLVQLIEAVAKKEGQTTAVWAMYGVPLRLSKSFKRQKDGLVCRYLLLPNQKAVLIGPNEPFKLLDQTELIEELEIEEDGWLGDQAHLKSQSYFVPGIENDKFSADPDNETVDDGDLQEPDED
jgi:hypothetical protein